MKAPQFLFTFLLILFSTQLLSFGQNSLVVFLQGNQGTEEGVMNTADLNAIENLAKELGVDFKTIAAKDGVPKEVTHTPAIFLMSPQGRSKYYGRYNNIPRLETFIRSASMQATSNKSQGQMFANFWTLGRTKVLAEFKITDLEGEVPEDFDQDKFKRETKSRILKGMQAFQLFPRIETNQGDRKFYFAIYPYLHADTFYVTLEMYSQFNCVEPLLRTFETPIAGPKKDQPMIFEAIGRFLFQKTQEAIFQLDRGDHFFPINIDHPTKTWEQLGLELPKGGASAMAIGELNLKGTLNALSATEANKAPLTYRFQAPLDAYVGLVKDVSGVVNMPTKNSIENLQARFKVKVKSVDMGDPGLNDHIWSDLLEEKFPEAEIDLLTLDAPKSSLAWGEILRATAKAELKMMGKSVPVDMQLQFEPRMLENAKQGLSIYGTFSLNIKSNFGIEGPDGPSPNNEIVEFFFDFVIL